MGAGLPHVGPWDYIQHVPMLWYGPGDIKAQGGIGGNVTLADIAPTQAKIFDRLQRVRRRRTAPP